MILGSHNSWSYLKPKKLWMKALAFTAKCQEKNIKEQYETYGVRCFDLRIRFDGRTPHIVHNDFDYGRLNDIEKDLQWLNDKGDVWIRIIHDVRKKKDHTEASVINFATTCSKLIETYPGLKFWCGRNLENWEQDCILPEPKCTELYASVCPPKIVDDWYPHRYAKKNNKDIYKNIAPTLGENEILLIDFVNIK